VNAMTRQRTDLCPALDPDASPQERALSAAVTSIEDAPKPERRFCCYCDELLSVDGHRVGNHSSCRRQAEQEDYEGGGEEDES